MKNSKMELYIIDEVAFFSNPEVVKKDDFFTIIYTGEEGITVLINDKPHTFTDGECNISMDDLIYGFNMCDVVIVDRRIPCEGIVNRSGYIMPAGITNKQYVLSLYDKAKKYEARCKELEEQVEALKLAAPHEDLFEIA